MIDEFHTITKEEIVSLIFPTDDVLTDKNDIKQRQADLERALTLGNVEHGKIKIYFVDNEKSYVVDTTIWGITDQRIILKKGVVIPINRILKVY
nr:hypothetical protein [uncultured Flavobacterium sp.]